MHSQRSSERKERKPSVVGGSGGNALAGMWSDSLYPTPDSDKTADDGERTVVYSLDIKKIYVVFNDAT